MDDQVTMRSDYGPFRAGKAYKIYDKGRDYYTLRSRGHLYYVPQSFVEEVKQWDVDVVDRRQLKSNRRQRQDPKWHQHQ
jgi:hypothetical protein